MLIYIFYKEYVRLQQFSETPQQHCDVHKGYASISSKDLPTGMQMGISQVNKIIESLQNTSDSFSINANLLVWGIGNDSPFWHNMTTGKVIFLEDNPRWFTKITKAYPYLEAYKVTYSTNLKISFERYSSTHKFWNELDMQSQLPLSVTNTNWNVIIVDAPLGSGKGPGRYQSIYMSKLLLKAGHVFVDDCERKIEHVMGDLILGENNRVSVETRDRLPNKQCHYVIR